MTAKEAGMKILLAKQRSIKYRTNLDYITDADRFEAESWGEDVWENILHDFYKDGVNDADCCPWCLRYFSDDCIGCEYGDRNGCCDTNRTDNVYGRILSILTKRQDRGVGDAGLLSGKLKKTIQKILNEYRKGI